MASAKNVPTPDCHERSVTLARKHREDGRVKQLASIAQVLLVAFQKNSDPTAPELPPGVNAAPELLPSPALETSSGVPALLHGAFIASVQHWVFVSPKGAMHTAQVDSII